MRKMNVKLLGLMGVTGLVGVNAAASAALTTLYDSHGFESAYGYSVGPLTGQATTGAAPWGQAGGGNIAAQVFQYSMSTQQGVVISDSNASSSDSGYWAPTTYESPNTAFTPLAGSTDPITITWTEQYAAGATGNPFFGLVVFNGNDIVATAGLDATNGGLVTEDAANTYETSNFYNGSNASAGTYYNFKVVLNYGAPTQNYAVYINNQLVDTENFVTPATSFTDADLSSYVISASSATGYGYFDNYLVTAGPVPEPASLSLLAVGGLVLGRRRRA